jgi:penicillin amidase
MKVQLKSIQDQTTVYFDDFGVPHIYAPIDAMTALDMSMLKIVCGKWN